MTVVLSLAILSKVQLAPYKTLCTKTPSNKIKTISEKYYQNSILRKQI